MGGVPAAASIKFDADNSCFAMLPVNSKLLLNNANKIIGFSQRSIIRNGGDLQAPQWTEQYQSGDIISEDPGFVMPSPHITTNNSNAIVALKTTVSNAIALIRFNSNAIHYLNARINSGFLGPTRYIAPGNPLTATSNMVYNASNNVIQFSSGNNLVVVAPNQTLVMQNVVLNDFAPNSFLQTASQGNLIFGDQTVVNLGVNLEGGSSDLLTLNYTWTFTGRSTLDGGNRTLTMGPLGNIVALKGAQVSINNLLIRNVNGNNIRCTDDSATFYFSGVQLQLNAAFSFTTGSLVMASDFELSGQVTFAYQSSMPLTILPNSSLIVDTGITFSWDPWDGNQLGLVFTDQTSVLYLDASTLHVTKGGLQLQGGSVGVEDQASFYVEGGIDPLTGSVTPNGLILGGDYGVDDCVVAYENDAAVNVYGGALIYRNMFPDSWQMSGYASLLRIQPGAMLMLDESMTLGVGSLMLSRQAKFQVAPGAQLIGSQGTF
jgi:hypothetical protein